MIAMKTIAQVLTPLRDNQVITLSSYQRLVVRWQEKSLSKKQIEILGYLLREFATLFTRERLTAHLERAEALYVQLINAKKSSLFIKDEQLAMMISYGVPKNPWIHVVVDICNDIAPSLDFRTETGRLFISLFLALLSIIRSENRRARKKEDDSPQGIFSEEQKSGEDFSRDSHDDFTDEMEAFTKELITKNQDRLDVSQMSIEEQIRKYDLHEDSY
jgi:hypothetical protein